MRAGTGRKLQRCRYSPSCNVVSPRSSFFLPPCLKLRFIYAKTDLEEKKNSSTSVLIRTILHSSHGLDLELEHERHRRHEESMKS